MVAESCYFFIIINASICSFLSCFIPKSLKWCTCMCKIEDKHNLILILKNKVKIRVKGKWDRNDTWIPDLMFTIHDFSQKFLRYSLQGPTKSAPGFPRGWCKERHKPWPSKDKKKNKYSEKKKKIRRIPGNESCEKFLLQIILENEENCMRGKQCPWQYPAVKAVSQLGFQGTILESSSALVSSQSKESWKVGCCPLLSLFCPLSWL